MKVLSFDRNAGACMSVPPQITVIPDSAIVPGSNPIFLADFSIDWAGQLCIAYRVSRLGKSISEKFAPRYYDAVTLCLRAHAVDMESMLVRDKLAAGICGAFDSCLAVGNWHPLPADKGQLNISSTSWSGEVEQSAVGECAALSLVSRYLTLKTGDIIMPCRLGPLMPLHRDTVFEASLNGIPLLRVKIK